MTRHKTPIAEYQVSNDVKLDVGIEAATHYHELDACIKAGLDPWKWEMGIYPPHFKAVIMAYVETRALIDLNVADAQQTKRKRDERKQSARGGGFRQRHKAKR